jgi:uncharacterized protein YxeA
MKKPIITILSIVAFVGGFLIFYQSRPARQNTPVINQTGQQANNSQKWETKTDDQVNVTVVVTPTDLSPQSIEWKFDIGMNTHSVELDQDMMKSVVLIDDQGKEYRPLKWEGPVGGHHREGVLTFNRIMPTPKSIELKVSGIGDVVRSFTW